MKLKSIEIIESKSRISSVDIFRGFAILPVVLFHFNNTLPFGYLGVDLFFVISGLLVGSILITQYKSRNKINFFQFVLQRGFKIWPSYYSFFIFGTILGMVLLEGSPKWEVFRWGKDLFRYLFFYQNYTGKPFHWSFDHVWSLCIEEHFYILLPILFIITAIIFRNNFRMLLLGICGLIFSGIIFKFFSYYFMPDFETYSATHTRIDSLGWGVLLGLLVNYYEEFLFKRKKQLVLLFIGGLILFFANILLLEHLHGKFYKSTIFHTVAPFCFFLMILGLYYKDFSKWKVIRFIAYYSYNWYLWHPIFVLIVIKYFGVNWYALVIYLLLSFITAVIFTIFVEENFLRWRNPILQKFFKPKIESS